MTPAPFPNCPKCGRSLESVIKNRLDRCGKCNTQVGQVIAEWRLAGQIGAQVAAAQADPVAALRNAKRMLDEGLISPEEYEAAKQRAIQGQAAITPSGEPSLVQPLAREGSRAPATPAKKGGGAGRTILVVAGILVALILVTVVASNNSGRQAATTGAPTTTAAASGAKNTAAPAAEAPTAVAVAADLGTTENPYPPDAVVTLGGARWTLVKAGKTNKLPQTFGDTKTTTNQYVVVVVQVENVGSDPISVAPLGLVDSKGREFNQASAGFKLDPEALMFTDSINPGLTLIYSNVYEVPKDATGFVVNISDTKIFGATALLSLGDLAAWK